MSDYDEQNRRAMRDYPGDPPDEPDITGWHQDKLDAFRSALGNEWLTAREDNPPFHSLHEGYCVLLEEVEELERLVFMPRRVRGMMKVGHFDPAVVKECIQIATMAYCIIDECTNSSALDIEHYALTDFPEGSFF